MERKMETTVLGYIGYILGLYWGYIKRRPYKEQSSREQRMPSHGGLPE